MRQIKHIADILTVNTREAILKDDPYVNPDLYKYYIRDTAGNYWDEAILISLSYGQFAKQLCIDKNESIETQTCKTISHEYIHHWLHQEVNIKVCAQFDNIAESLEPYGVW